jgi:hypothetical protein
MLRLIVVARREQPDLPLLSPIEDKRRHADDPARDQAT